MKLFLIAVVLCIVGDYAAVARKKATTFPEYQNLELTDNKDQDHNAFLNKFYPNYTPDNKHAERVKNFHKCRQTVLNWDPDANGYAVGINHFCHWTEEEFNKSLNPTVAQTDLPASVTRLAIAAQESDAHNRVRQTSANFSWVALGAVSSVKNQGSCGCCYTFAAAAALEGAYQIKYGALYNFSTQQYVDCSIGTTVTSNTATSTSCRGGVCTTTINYYDNWFISASGNNGCNGGQARACWAYNNMTGSVQNSWNCYPFFSGTTTTPGQCQYSASCSPSAGVRNYVDVQPNESALLNAVNLTPVACAIDSSTIQNYAGGIFTGNGCSQTNLNHAITVVGYGSAGGVNYWLIKNSWDVTWGENGYLRLLRGSNTCGISNSCQYPIVQ